MDELLISKLKEEGRLNIDSQEAEAIAEYILTIDPSLEIYSMTGRHRKRVSEMKEGDITYKEILFFDKRVWEVDEYGTLSKIVVNRL